MGWLRRRFVKKVIGSVVRRLIDIGAGALLAMGCFGTSVCDGLAGFIVGNTDQIEELTIAAILALGSLAWSVLQKYTDNKEIEQLRNK